MVNAYPLKYPIGKERTKPSLRERSRFGEKKKNSYGFMTLRPVTHTKALNSLFGELDRLGAKNTVLSTNLELRNDGLPRANQRKLDDPGVACYFDYKKKQMCFACDKWDRVEDNIYAIAKTIEAIRGIERWGSKDMLESAFRGFQALPDYTSDRPAIIPQQDYFSDCIDRLEVKEKYKRLVHELHPDKGGDTDQFQEMKRQYDRRMKNPN